MKIRKKILIIINKIKEEGLDNVLPSLISRWFTKDFTQNNKNIIAKRFKQVQDTPLNTFLNVFQIYALTEMSPWLHEITVPCLVMTGENDLGCNPEINKKIANTLQNSKLEILENYKHTITLEAPKLVGNKIKTFLKNYEYNSIFD